MVSMSDKLVMKGVELKDPTETSFDLHSMSNVWEITDILVGVALLITLIILIKKLSRNEHGAYNYLIWWFISLVVYIILRNVLV